MSQYKLLPAHHWPPFLLQAQSCCQSRRLLSSLGDPPYTLGLWLLLTPVTFVSPSAITLFPWSHYGTCHPSPGTVLPKNLILPSCLLGYSLLFFQSSRHCQTGPSILKDIIPWALFISLFLMPETSPLLCSSFSCSYTQAFHPGYIIIVQ